MLRHLQTPKLHSPSSNLRLSKKALDFRIQISSDSKSLGIPLRGQKTGHVVIRQVHAVWPLIHQYRDRGVRSGIRNVLCHFLHDERIANHKAHDFRILPSGLLTQNRAMIQFHKQHKASPAQTSLNHASQFSEVPCALGCLRELDHIRSPNGHPECRHNCLERLGRDYAEPFDLDLLNRHVSSPGLLAEGPTVPWWPE